MDIRAKLQQVRTKLVSGACQSKASSSLKMKKCHTEDSAKYGKSCKTGDELKKILSKNNISAELLKKSFKFDITKDLTNEAKCKQLLEQIQAFIKDGKFDKENFEKFAKVKEICNKYSVNFAAIKKKYWDNFINAAKYIEEQQANGNLKSLKDKFKIKKLLMDYTMIQSFGWTIEGFVEANKKNHDGIRKRLIKMYGMNPLAGPKELENKSKTYIKSYYSELLQKETENKQPKTEAERNAIRDRVNKLFNQDIGKLLVNTLLESDKAAFRGALAAVNPSEREKIFDLAVAKIEGEAKTQEEAQQQVQDFANETAKDLEEVTEGMSEDTAASFTENVISKASSNVAEDVTKKLNKSVVEYYNEHKEIIDKGNRGEELTEEEQEIYNTYKTKLGNDVGSDNGIYLNTNIDEQRKFQIVAEEDTFTQNNSEGYYRAKNIFRKNYIEAKYKDDEEFLNQIFNFYNKTTNNNFSKINEDINCELNSPVIINNSSDNGIAYSTNQTAAENSQIAAKIIQAQIESQSETEPEKFEICRADNKKSNNSDESNNTEHGQINLNGKTVSELVEYLKSGKIDFTNLIKQYSAELSGSGQMYVDNEIKIKSADEQEYYLNQASNNDAVKIMERVGLTDEGLNVELDYSNKKRIENDAA